MTNADYEVTQVTKNFIEVNLYGEKTHIDKGYLHWALGEVIGWQQGRTNFTACLMALIAKADNNNRKKIAKGFREEVFAYLLWYYKEGLITVEDSEKFIGKLREWLKSSSSDENIGEEQ